MVSTMKNITQVPRLILDEYSQFFWFGVYHGTTYVRPKIVTANIFHMKHLPFYVFEEVFHNEVNSWIEISYEF